MHLRVRIYLLATRHLLLLSSGNALCYGKTSNEDDLLKDAGCNKGGKLLSKSCCINLNYQKYVAPDENVTVYTTITRKEVIDMRENENTITLDIEMEQSWTDPRIIINMDHFDSPNGYVRFQWDKVLDLEKSPIIWIPWYHDISIIDMLKIRSQYGSFKNSFENFGIFYTNTLHHKFAGVKLTIDFIVTIYCRFDYKGYPWDRQVCSFRLASSPYRSLKLLLFDPTKKYHLLEKRNKAFGFDITTSFVDKNVTHSDIFQNQIGFDMEIRRILQPFLFQYYLPCTAIVLVSQTGFMVPLSALSGRITLGVTQFLALTNVYIFQQVT